MTQSQEPPAARKNTAILKVLYLLFVTALVFAVPAVDAIRFARWWIISSLLVLQIAVLIMAGVDYREVLRPLGRLKWLFIILISCYAFLPGDASQDATAWQSFPILGFEIWVNIYGMAVALLMCLQIWTVLLASSVVRLTGPGTDMVVGLRAIGLPRLFVYPLDLVLAKLSGAQRSGGGTGKRRQQTINEPARLGFFAVFLRLIRGDVAAFPTAIRSALDDARQQVEDDAGHTLDSRFAHDVGVIAGIGLVMVGFKMLKLLPGVPLASGHKTLLLFPLYILAARLTHTRWGGTTAGAVMGVIGFLQGDGRFGIFEVLKHIAPGILIDLLMPIVQRLPERAWVYCSLGLLAGFARLTSELVVLLLLGTRAEVYVFLGIKMIPTLIASTLSGFVALTLLKMFPAERLPGSHEKSTATEAERVLVCQTKEAL